jgi:hypothetical protein
VTIATCYVSPEGIVLGADSTSTVAAPGNFHYFDYAQKLFEIGEGSTLAAVTWGLGGLVVSSHRTLLAMLADDLGATKPADVLDVTTRWASQFGTAYAGAAPLGPSFQRCNDLSAKPAFDPTTATPDPAARTKDEESEFSALKNALTVGFCVAGYVLPSREPKAYELIFSPATTQPTPT